MKKISGWMYLNRICRENNRLIFSIKLWNSLQWLSKFCFEKLDSFLWPIFFLNRCNSGERLEVSIILIKVDCAMTASLFSIMTRLTLSDKVFSRSISIRFLFYILSHHQHISCSDWYPRGSYKRALLLRRNQSWREKIKPKKKKKTKMDILNKDHQLEKKKI